MHMAAKQVKEWRAASSSPMKLRQQAASRQRLRAMPRLVTQPRAAGPTDRSTSGAASADPPASNKLRTDQEVASR